MLFFFVWIKNYLAELSSPSESIPALPRPKTKADVSVISPLWNTVIFYTSPDNKSSPNNVTFFQRASVFLAKFSPLSDSLPVLPIQKSKKSDLHVASPLQHHYIILTIRVHSSFTCTEKQKVTQMFLRLPETSPSSSLPQTTKRIQTMLLSFSGPRSFLLQFLRYQTPFQCYQDNTNNNPAARSDYCETPACCCCCWSRGCWPEP